MSSGRAGGGDRLSGTHFWSPRSGGGLPSTGQQKKGGGGYTKTFANEEEVSVFEDARSEIDEIKVSKCLIDVFPSSIWNSKPKTSKFHGS